MAFLFEVAGVAAIVAGVALFCVPAAFIVGGALVIAAVERGGYG